MSDIQTISIILAGIGIFIAAVNSIITSRQANQQRQTEIETRQAELFMNVYNRWNTRDIQMAYGKERFLLLPQIHEYADYQRIVLDERAKGNLEPWYQGQILVTYFEGLGTLMKQGLINIEMVDDLFARRIVWFWETFGPICEIRRQKLGDLTMFDSIEYLYNEDYYRDTHKSALRYTYYRKGNGYENRADDRALHPPRLLA